MTLTADLTATVLRDSDEQGWERRRGHPELWSERYIGRRRDIVFGADIAIDRERRVIVVDPSWWPAGDGPLVGPGELARTYLRRALVASARRVARGDMAFRRFPWSHTDRLNMEAAPAPLWWSAPAELRGNWAYVDISAAYAQLWAPWSPSASFWPGRWCGRPERTGRWWRWREVLRLPKQIRNAAFGIMGADSPITVWQRGQPVARKAWNPLYAPRAVGYTLWMMNACAAEAIRRFSLPMWATDGGICRADQAADLVAWLRSRWGLRSRIVARGEGELWGLSDFAIGDHERRGTAHRPGPPVAVFAPFLTPELCDWLARAREESAA